jgi:hypothetical protein
MEEFQFKKSGWVLDEDGEKSRGTRVPSSLVTKNLKECGEGEPRRGNSYSSQA